MFDEPPIKTADNKKAIIKYIEMHEQGANKDFAQLLGLKPTRIKELLRQLVKDEIILPQGNNRNRTYILNNRN